MLRSNCTCAMKIEINTHQRCAIVSPIEKLNENYYINRTLKYDDHVNDQNSDQFGINRNCNQLLAIN